MGTKNIVWLEEVGKDDISLVGGKGANLGELLNAGLPVPYGFVVTAKAYFNFIEHNHLHDLIKHTFAYINKEHSQELQQAASIVQKSIREAHVPHELIEHVGQYYHDLRAREAKLYKNKSITLAEDIKSLYDLPYVAIRSSATAEDLPGASFAGQQETYLNVRGENHLIHMMRECWASLFTERAIYYREEQGFDHLSVGLAAVVQRMIQSDVSGIAFSIDPVTNSKDTLTIEAIYGLGEYIVQGKVTPDHYEVDKSSLDIQKRTIQEQTISFVKRGEKNIEQKVPSDLQKLQKLPDSKIKDLSKLIVAIEKHYYFPQDIEWALEGDTIYIVQARPITTNFTSPPIDPIVPIVPNSETPKSGLHPEILVIGSPASPGIRSGQPVILHKPTELDRVKTGMVLVAEQTNPDYVPAMKRASAIVTEKGGRTSHAAIVARELGIPAIVGAENAIKILQNEKIVTVNGSTGHVLRGSYTAKPAPQVHHTLLKTRTKVYVNLAEPDRLGEVSKMNVDGIGLLRAEFMLADIGDHPKAIMREGRQAEFIETLADRLTEFASSFSPRPVVYRASDFKTNEYSHLKGGQTFESHEENPMMGYRGAARFIADPKVFELEIEAIKKVRAKGFQNLHLMIPFVRAPEEITAIRTMLERDGILEDTTFKLWMMVETPSVALTLDRYIKLGIDGVSIGTNDLTMLTLGVDRDNASVSTLYTEQDPAVHLLIRKIIATAVKHGITCSLCGQAASDDPELLELLIRDGITSVSVNVDALDRTRMLIHDLEKRLH